MKGKIIFLYICIGITILLHFLWFTLPIVTYPLNKAQAYLCLARSSIDLNSIADNLEKAYLEIKDLHGNPCWWYPTKRTDLDYNKEILLENIELARKVANTSSPSEYGYQRCVDNIQEMILDLEDHIEEIKRWYLFSLPNVIFTLLYAVGLVIIVIAPID